MNIHAGVITTDKKKRLAQRLNQLVLGVLDVLSIADHVARDHYGIVVEFPAAYGRYGAHAATAIPKYGMAVGATYTLCVRHTRRADDILTPGAGEWPGRDTPTTRGDPKKTGRVEYVCERFGLARKSLGPKCRAGDVADAILLADWGRTRMPGMDRVVAFDPSLTSTGYAIIGVER